ncbi:MAG: 4-hydroxy-2-oxovalerate aldolase [Candidatus Curtissbacteria bacterium]|nr:4-hydroxy-2-oxovalerate aldolase [Candidatus Curtissbacteria bacterium]
MPNARSDKKKLSPIIVDSTLRDGSHAVSHQFTAEDISNYSKGAEDAKIPILMVGHGNGLGASSLQLGISLLSDNEMLRVARKQLKNTKLGAFLIPGFGTIKENVEPAISVGVDVMMVACHCTEATVTRQHIEYICGRGITVYGVLMMSHMISAKELLAQALLMQEYGASGVLLMDSAGAYLPGDVSEKVKTLASGLKIDVGFHAHNNLSLAVWNTVTALLAGAKILDTCSRGLGAGAGNCQLEVLVAVLFKMGYPIDLDLYKLMDNSEDIIAKIMKKPQIISSISLTSGLAGVFSGFAPHAKRVAERFGVDPRDILIELGKRKVVAGQEDIIIEVAMLLKQKRVLKKQIDLIEALI